MEQEDIQGKIYPSPGRCIYCGSDGGEDGLRDEHMVPFSAGGNAFIKEASCTRCEKITSYLEGYLTHNVLYHMRIHADVQTRRKYPNKLPAEIVMRGKDEVLPLDIKDHPFFLQMPVWQLPGVMNGRSLEEDFGQIHLHLYYWVPPNLRETLGLSQEEIARVKPPDANKFNYRVFARAIAKIAYCHAVALYGLDGFRPLIIPDLILGRYPHIAYFVGSPPELPPPPEDRGRMHAISHSELTIGRMKFRLISVRLFAHSGTKGFGTRDYGMPVYHVITGTLNPGKSIVRRPRPVLFDQSLL